MTVRELIEELFKYPPDMPVELEAEYDCGFGLAGSDKIDIRSKETYVILHADE